MTKVLNGISVKLNERETVILKVLRDLYDSKHGFLLVSVDGIAYYLTRSFFDKSVEKDKTMLQNMKVTVLSLAEKGVITILDKDLYANNFLLSSKGLKVKRKRRKKEEVQNRTIKISDEKIIEFYIANGLAPIRKYCCELSGRTIWEFNRDEENKRLYKQWCDMEKERIVKKYKEKRGIN